MTDHEQNHLTNQQNHFERLIFFMKCGEKKLLFEIDNELTGAARKFEMCSCSYVQFPMY